MNSIQGSGGIIYNLLLYYVTGRASSIYLNKSFGMRNSNNMRRLLIFERIYSIER